MLKIGRYGIALSPVLWFQTKAPTKVWHFLCFWFLKEVRASDVDRKRIDKRPAYPLNTLLEQEGRRYRYWRAGRDIKIKEIKAKERLRGNDKYSN